ncbi:MAG: haloacid dehalogenase type II, partial [Betaproteobacteria bacterium]|nr:haloacid dehalogenase type II [Betaproteobacteria bacterium]
MVLPKVAAFDVFGTVVDWHGSICEAVEALKLDVSPSEFALAWRSLYQPAMARVRQGEVGWTSIDVLHRQNLDQVLDRFKIEHLSAAQKHALNQVWHRLKPWPDAVEGLQRLRKGMMICTLSNGNLSLLANMAKFGSLPWDLILSAEVFKHYKPDP